MQAPTKAPPEPGVSGMSTMARVLAWLPVPSVIVGLAIGVWYTTRMTFQGSCYTVMDDGSMHCPEPSPDWVAGLALGMVCGVGTYVGLALIAVGVNRVLDARR